MKRRRFNFGKDKDFVKLKTRSGAGFHKDKRMKRFKKYKNNFWLSEENFDE